MDIWSRGKNRVKVAGTLHYHTRMFVTARAAKVTSAFTATMANLVTKTIHVFKHRDRGEVERDWNLQRRKWSGGFLISWTAKQLSIFNMDLHHARVAVS